jgi:hypothetical protein
MWQGANTTFSYDPAKGRHSSKCRSALSEDRRLIAWEQDDLCGSTAVAAGEQVLLAVLFGDEEIARAVSGQPGTAPQVAEDQADDPITAANLDGLQEASN